MNSSIILLDFPVDISSITPIISPPILVTSLITPRTSFSGRNTSTAHKVAFVTDFSVVLFRPNFMLPSEEYRMKVHKNQWLLNLLYPLDIPWRATNQGTTHGV